MRWVEIERRAIALGLKDTWKYSKKNLIKAIQRREGNSECFDTTNGYCDQLACCWREDCLR